VKVGWILGLVFGSVGLLFLGIAGATFVAHQNFAASAVHAEGTVVEDLGCPKVHFQVGARTVEFYGGTRSTPPSYKAGDKVAVLYPASAPESAAIDSFFESYLLTTIFGAIGLPFAGVGGVFLFVNVRAARRRARALAIGQKVGATVTAINLDTTERVNGQSPSYVEATYTDQDTGQTYTFKSESVWTDLEATFPIGSEITVCYLADDPTVYAVVLDK
jgi:hypothetical protein